MMTRKDYVAFAQAFVASKPHPWADCSPAAQAVGMSVWNHAIRTVADVLAADNPRFDRERFLKAAGVAS